MDYEATLNALHGWLGSRVGVIVLCGDPPNLQLARLDGTLHSGHKHEERVPKGFDLPPSDGLFFALTNSPVVLHTTGFFIVERTFTRAEWADDAQTVLVIESWMAKHLVIRIPDE
jgi:hypothetical protein